MSSATSPLMQFIVLSRLGTGHIAMVFSHTMRNRRPSEPAHCFAQGHQRQIWFRGDESGAVRLFEASDAETVRAMVQTRVLVEAGLLRLCKSSY